MSVTTPRAIALTLLVTVCAVATVSCGPVASDDVDPSAADGTTDAREPLPESAYHLQSGLEEWIDPETGYDTTREWKLEGGQWPIVIIMSPSQSPQALIAERDGLFADALEPFGITPVIDKIDVPPRTFHALERSKWPFAYMPLAVFMDYARSADNQGGAGGLQYVALAGSTAGGGYTMLAKDPEIEMVGDLKGRTVGQVNYNPYPGTLLTKAAEEAGLTVGDGPDGIRLTFGEGGDQYNRLNAGEIDAVIALNISRKQLIDQGAHPVTDFSDVGYTPNYTILAVERSVLEEKPEVVRAVLEAHYEADKRAEKEWPTTMPQTLMESWNDYFAVSKADSASQRPVSNVEDYAFMLGDMRPDDRLDERLLADCFAFNDRYGHWGWDGSVDTARLVDFSLYEAVLEAQGASPQ